MLIFIYNLDFAILQPCIKDTHFPLAIGGYNPSILKVHFMGAFMTKIRSILV